MARRLEHGGGLDGGRRKLARPLSTQEPIYVLLRSTRAKGRLAMNSPEFGPEVRSIINRQAENCRIQVLQFMNEGNSLHFLLIVPSRACYQRFIRSVCGLISRCVTGAERGRSIGSKRAGSASRGTKPRPKFWDVIPFSRISPEAKSIRQALNQIDDVLLVELGLQLRRRQEVKKPKVS